MIPTANIKFLDCATTPQISREYNNGREDILVLEVTSNKTSPTFEIIVEAIVDDKEDEWVPISGIDMKSYVISSDGIVSKNGIYQYAISGVGKFRINLKSISGGMVSAFARIGAEVL